uniref:Indolepyruvate oxidoreductase n=1 Tax=Fervidicoccus fontis TaxID=683846 RepID=A0A7J3SLI9_9CREN
MGNRINILISSVGGQGGLSLSRMIAVASGISGYSVATGETLGMAQRFGSVKSFVRIGLGEKVYSPVFSLREADYLLCLELIECTRNLGYLRENGRTIASLEVKPPISMSLEASKSKPNYSQYIEALKSFASNEIIFIDPDEVRRAAGTIKAVNAAILGAFVSISNLFEDKVILESMREVLGSEKAIESSRKAYELGKSLAKKEQSLA